MSKTKRPLKVFLCHAHSDKANVKALYERLVEDGVDAWLDKEKLLPGQDWELEIRKAVRESDVIVVCLSSQFNNAGFRQKEVRLALDTAMEKPEGEIFIIPARLEDCESLESLRRWHWVDLFEDNGYDMLIRALQARANSIAATLQVRKAAIDTKSKSPRISSVSARKPFKLKPEYLVAVIGAAATIIAAVISSPLIERWFTQTSEPTATATTQAQASPTESFSMTLRTEMLSPVQTNPSPVPGLLPGSTIKHSVTAGDSLFQIARCYGADFEKLLSANPQISDAENLSPGMMITVPNIGSSGKVSGPPCVIFYTVLSGDTWASIAQRYNADTIILQRENENIPFEVGQILVVPFNSAPTVYIPPSKLSTLFTVEDDVPPGQDDCYGLDILPNREVYITNTTSTDLATFVVHGPSESVVKDTADMILYGSPSSESSNYKYCIFNRSASTIEYKLEVSLSN